jgi:hypothetical protein
VNNVCLRTFLRPPALTRVRARTGNGMSSIDYFCRRVCVRDVARPLAVRRSSGRGRACGCRIGATCVARGTLRCWSDSAQADSRQPGSPMLGDINQLRCRVYHRSPRRSPQPLCRSLSIVSAERGSAGIFVARGRSRSPCCGCGHSDGHSPSLLLSAALQAFALAHPPNP